MYCILLCLSLLRPTHSRDILLNHFTDRLCKEDINPTRIILNCLKYLQFFVFLIGSVQSITKYFSCDQPHPRPLCTGQWVFWLGWCWSAMINLVSAGSQKRAQRGGGESKEKLFSGPVQIESKELLHI